MYTVFVVYRHEYMCGYYTVSSYFLGKVLCDMIPRRMLHSFILTFIPYVIVGKRQDLRVKPFSFVSTLTVLQTTDQAISYGLLA